MEFVPGPDFPTGGIIVSSREALAETYRTGRGGIRVRARWEKEDPGRGTWVVVVTEIPYQVQKSRLIEQIAGLIENRKLPLVGDVRDESAEDVRIVIEPKSRTVDPALMMESLFHTDRAGIALLAQHERAVARPGAERPVAARRADGVAGPPQGRAGPAHALPPRQDRRAAGGARRLSDRLS